MPSVVIGLISLASYTFFAALITRQGDFYRIRRWKAAICCALIGAVIAVVIAVFCFALIVLKNSSFLQNPDFLAEINLENVFQFLFSISKAFLTLAPCLTTMLFVVTFGTYSRLKWWLNSDDYLDKIWKDPNRNKKSPVQWL
jgi:hypothetical protein